MNVNKIRKLIEVVQVVPEVVKHLKKDEYYGQCSEEQLTRVVNHEIKLMRSGSEQRFSEGNRSNAQTRPTSG